MKKSVSLLLSLLMVISIITSMPLTASAASVDDLKFKLNDDRKSYCVYSCEESAEGKLVIPSTYKNKPVTEIYVNAFRDCTSIKSITIPDSVTSINWGAFSDCTSLESVEIPDSVKSIGDDAFENCTSLKSIEIPDSVTSISFGVFYNCTSLKSVEIPDSVKSIGSSAFGNCTSLTSIEIPDSVTSIGSSAFKDCTSLESITVDSENKKFSSVDGVLFNKKKTTLIQYPAGKTNSTYTILDNVTKIGSGAFYKSTSLTSIEIPDSVTSIGSSAFENCTSLTSIEIPDSVTNIGKGAFCNTAYYNNDANREDGVLYIGNHLIAANKYIEEEWSYTSNVSGDYVIKRGTKTIAGSAFEGCTDLTSIKIPDSVISIGDSAFYKCTSLDTIIIPDSVTNIGDWAFRGCTSITSITIPDSVICINNRAFEGCKSLTSIEIPDSVTSIGSRAFYNCTSLESATIGSSVTKIGSYAFFNCDGLTSIKIPESVTLIDRDAFYGCSSLKKITIPDTPITIRSDAFTYTIHQQLYVQSDYYYIGNHLIRARVRNVEIKPGTVTIAEGACQNVVSVTIPDSVILISEYAFSQSDRLKSITIPDSVKSIGKNAFEGCTSLKSATIGNSVSNIGSSVFSGCTSLTSITIPDSVTSIGEKAFYKCTSLKSIKIPDSVTSISSTAFDGCSDLTINCSVNSYAHKFATKNGIKCKTNCKHKTTKWVTAKKATVYKAGEKHKECTVCDKVIKTAKIAQLKCSKPTLKKVANTPSGVKITWGKVKGGDSYNIYRRTKSGSYNKIGTTKNTYYTDKKAKSGKRYYYIVKAVNEAGTSASSSAKSILHLADPTLKTPSSTKSGITLKWTKVTGAEGYIIYRKTGSGSYTKLKTEKGVSNLSYRDKSAKKGKTYTYKVKAYKSKTYSAYSNAKKIKDKY